MLFAAMPLNQQHEFLFAIAAHLPITVLSHHIRALELECSLVLFIREVIHALTLPRTAEVTEIHMRPMLKTY